MKPISESPLLAENPAQGSIPIPIALHRISQIADAGPRYFYRWALVSLAVTALLAMAITIDVRPVGPLPESQRYLIAGALVVFCAAVGLALVALFGPIVSWPWLDHLAAPEERAAIWLSLAVWFPLLLVVVYLKAITALPHAAVWTTFGYDDKRWVTSAYLLGVLGPMILLVAATRVVAASRSHPATWRAWLAALAPGPKLQQTAPAGVSDAPNRASGWRRLGQKKTVVVVAGLLTALVIAYYFYGPPWYLDRSKDALWVGYQEDVFLSGFQAMSHGAVPYIGAAANQYGPGAEFLSYWYMRHVTSFSIVGFRESWAVFLWVGTSILFAVFFLAFGYIRGLIATLLSALIYPALHLLGFMPGQSFTGFFGWPNPLRYVGAIALVLLLPTAIRRYPARLGLFVAGVLGLLFGATSFIGQENLIAGIVGALVVSALLTLTGSASLRSVVRVLISACAGFMVVWVPVLAYYAVNGVLARFLYLYFLFPEAVAEGYTDTPYGGVNPHPDQIAMDAPLRTFYYVLPFLLAIVALLVVVQFRPFRVVQSWSAERITVAAIVVTTILLYQGALLRADSEHLFGTELAVPALVIMATTALPRLVGFRHRMALVSGGVLILTAFLVLLPYSSVQFASVKAWAAAPLRDRQRLAAESQPRTPTTSAGQRVGAGMAGARQCCQGASEPMTNFVQLMQRIHLVAGNRTTYVVGFPNGYPGIVYFVADLAPAPTSIDFSTMVLTVHQERAYLADFRARVMPRTYALVTDDLHAAEVRYFRSAYSHARTVTLTFDGKAYWVLLRPRA